MAITALAAIFELAPVAVLGGSSGLSAAERQTLALAFLKVGDNVGRVSLLFSGFFQILNGYLMFRSGFLPRIFGVLIALAGFGWFVFLASPVANSLMTLLEGLGFLGELPLMLWLTIMGVNSQRWNERLAAGAIRSAT